MKLTRTERWILANQYRLLEALDPQEKEAHARAREVLESGYEALYGMECEHVYADVLDEQQCKLVTDTLSMFQALQRSASGKSLSKEMQARLKFRGFDGNNETKYMGYAEFFCVRLNRFGDVEHPAGFNSHSPMVVTYKRMLERWNASGDRVALTQADLERILAV